MADVDEGGVGLGVDVVEISRVERIVGRSQAFVTRVYTEGERAWCERSRRPAQRYAARFAAKEAVLKALGTGFALGVRPSDVEVVSAEGRPPRVVLHGRAKEVAQQLGVVSLPVSLSHSHDEAVACAMAITRASMEQEQKRRDPMEELSKQFKQVRSMLDDMPKAGVDAGAESEGEGPSEPSQEEAAGSSAVATPTGDGEGPGADVPPHEGAAPDEDKTASSEEAAE